MGVEQIIDQALTHLIRGQLTGEDDLNNAVLLFSQALSVEPDNVEALTGKGRAFLYARKFDEALAELERAASLGKDGSHIQRDIGIALNELGRHDQALTHLNRSLELDPNDASAYMARADLHFNMKKTDEGLLDIMHAIGKNQSPHELAKSVLIGAGAYADKGEHLVALRHATAALYILATMPKPIPIIYVVFQDPAPSAMEITLNLDAGFVEAHTLKGSMERRLGFPKLAKDDFDVAFLHSPSLPQRAKLHSERGRANLDLGNLDDVLLDYSQVINLDPTRTSAYNNSGIALMRMERLDESLYFFDKTIELGPKHVGPYQNKGIVLNRLRRYSEALDSLLEAIRLQPTVDNMAYAGIGFSQLGNREKARQYFMAALSMFEQVPIDKRDAGSYTSAILAEKNLMLLRSSFEPRYEREAVERGIMSPERIRTMFKIKH